MKTRKEYETIILKQSIQRFCIEIVVTAGLTFYTKALIYVVLHAVSLPFTFFNHPLIRSYIFKEDIKRPFKPLTFIERVMEQLVEVRMMMYKEEKEKEERSKRIESLAKQKGKTRKDKIEYIKKQMSKKEKKMKKKEEKEEEMELLNSLPKNSDEVSFSGNNGKRKKK